MDRKPASSPPSFIRRISMWPLGSRAARSKSSSSSRWGVSMWVSTTMAWRCSLAARAEMSPPADRHSGRRISRPSHPNRFLTTRGTSLGKHKEAKAYHTRPGCSLRRGEKKRGVELCGPPGRSGRAPALLVLDDEKLVALLDPAGAFPVVGVPLELHPVALFGHDDHADGGGNQLGVGRRIGGLIEYLEVGLGVRGVAVLHHEDLRRRALGAQLVALLLLEHLDGDPGVVEDDLIRLFVQLVSVAVGGLGGWRLGQGGPGQKADKDRETGQQRRPAPLVSPVCHPALSPFTTPGLRPGAAGGFPSGSGNQN